MGISMETVKNIAAICTAVAACMGMLGAILPADNRLGQIVRRWFPDAANKNLNTTPPKE